MTRALVHRLVACALLVGLVVALDAGTASAHAILESTDPAAGATLGSSPKSVTLHYDESVTATIGAIRLFDGRGNRIEVGAPYHPRGIGSEVAANVPKLRDGSYVVTWRVISADSHPVQGAFTITVGNPSVGDVTSLASRLLTAQGGSTTVGVVYGIARFLVFASLALLVGAAVLVVTAWPSGRTSRRAGRIVWGAWIVAFVSTLAAFALQGAYAAGLPLSSALHTTQLRAVWHTRFGEVTILRAVLLLVTVVFLRQLLVRADTDGQRTDPPPLAAWWRPLAVVIAVAMVATPGLGGHASTGRWRWLALPADVVHVGAMAVWLGGLALLLSCVLPIPDPVLLRRVVPRFSRVAFWCIAAIVATGSFQAWRQVGSLHAFTSTDYGRLLLVKLAFVVVVVAAAALSRDVVHRRLREPYVPDLVPDDERVAVTVGGGGAGGTGRDGDDGDLRDDEDDDWTEEDEERAEVHRLRLSVAVEVVAAVLVLAVTALLVNAPPAYTAASLPYFKTVEQSGRFYDIEVTPAKAGPNDVHLTAVTVNGGPADVIKYTVTFSEPGKGIAPIAVPLLRLGPGHYASYAFRVPFPGTWQVSVSALISDTEESTFTLNVPIH